MQRSLEGRKMSDRPPIEEVYEDATKEERKWALNHCAQILQAGDDR